MAKIGNVTVGESSSVKIMGIINSSPESFYKRSVKTSESDIGKTAQQMQSDGAAIIDVGAMSTAPYLETLISAFEEASRMKSAVKALQKSGCSLPVSADTPRASVAESAIGEGALAINDVTGLKYDKAMAGVIAKAGVSVILGAHRPPPFTCSGRVSATVKELRKSISIAESAGIKNRNIIIDPSIGFFRSEGMNPFFTKMTDLPWYIRDTEVLSKLERLVRLAPVCVSISGKSFLGHLLGIEKADDRLAPSLACEFYAATKGAGIIRTHNVKQSAQALSMYEILAG